MAGEFEGDAIRQSAMYVKLDDRKKFGEPYHWALVLTDVEGPGATLHHCTDRYDKKWVHEVKRISRVGMIPDPDTLCLAGLGSIAESRRDEAERILGDVKIEPIGSKADSGEPFNCHTWLKAAVGMLASAGVVRLVGDADYLETNIRILAGQMVAKRYEGAVAAQVYDRA